MDEQLDNDLKNRIREVFENYEDPSANDGWLLLREKFPERRKRRAGWLWWGAAAAILLLFLGIGLWINNQNSVPPKVARKVLKHDQRQNTKDFKAPGREIEKTLPDENNIIAKSVPYNKKPTGNKRAASFNSGGVLVKSKNHHPYRREKRHVPSINPEEENQVAANTDTVKSNPDKTAATQIAANTKPDKTNDKVAKTEPEQPSDKKMASLLAQDKQTNDNKNTIKPHNVHFGVYAATYFNYAKGSSNSVNAGAGFSADIKITKNLKLVSGIAIAQNSLSFGSSAISTASQTQFATATISSMATLSKPGANQAIPLLHNYDASLVGLDVPVNLKYEFATQKNDVYVVAGLSSGTFINETYTYHYSYFNSGTLTSQQGQNQINNQSFNSFYFAKTLNVALGLGYPFGKNRLVIEPFLKYPLDGLGTQNIRFGSGGVNLKFNFLPQKK